LIASGLRPINNVVDVTNYVMVETGQPLHAFDFHTLEGASVAARRAGAGETLVTLDGVERRLEESMLVIADAGRAVSIAGVMGGLETEVTPRTSAVLLESAYFQPLSIRRTASALGIRSEASLRFEKGVDPNGQVFAAERAAYLLAQVRAGRPAAGIVDCHPGKVSPRVVRVRTDRVRTVVDRSLGDGEISRMLERYGFAVCPAGDGALSVTVPTRRVDVSEEADLIEEVARLYGYDRVRATLLGGSAAGGSQPPLRAFAGTVRAATISCGATEVSTLSIIDPRAFDRMMLPAGNPLRSCVRLMNPLAEEQSVMRTSLVPGLLEVLRTNASHRVTDACVFEIGRVFIPTGDPMTDLPDERVHLGVAAMGRTRPVHWGTEAEYADFYSAKGIVETILGMLGFDGCECRADEVPGASPVGPVAVLPALHPYRRATIRIGGIVVGVVGELHPNVAQAYDLPQRAAVSEVDLHVLAVLPGRGKKYRQLPRFPAVLRDVAVVAPDTMPASEIADEIREAAGPLLEAVRVFDVYSGGRIPPDHRSLAFSLTYRAPDRTLRDEEVDRVHSRVRTALEKAGLVLR
ncbi:MAG: phenylalanine--tRNA ligase subunit beta, partial [Firmicutes bacterium]|nr:phenylalanine--tRNA ligase subunit beta [Bacillota bacterium]